MTVDRLKFFRFSQMFINGIETLTSFLELSENILNILMIIQKIDIVTNSRIYYPLKRFELIEIKKFTMTQ